jgi:hypothetical protein
MTKKPFLFILFSTLFIIILSIITYNIQNIKYKKKNKGVSMPLFTFFNGVDKLPHWHDIVFGMIFGIIFGFLDNMFLFLGIDSLNELMPTSPIIQAGLGNTISDFIGAITGTYMAVIAKELLYYNDDLSPIWATTLGIVIGCLLGLYIPYYVKKYFF